MYLIYPYLNQWAFLEGFFGFVNAFASEFERFVELTRFHRPHASPEEEHLLFQCNMIQFALFERSLEHRLKKRHMRRADLTDRAEALACHRWTEEHGSRFEMLLKEHRADWCRRFAEFDAKAHVVLNRHATSAERRSKRQAETELDVLLAEIEDLL